MFTAEEPFALFDYFRVPYRLEGDAAARDRLRHLRADATQKTLLYPCFEASPRGVGAWLLGAIHVFGRALGEADMQALLAAEGGDWSPGEMLTGVGGSTSTPVWRSDSGDVALPFDPNEAILSYWSERYLDGSRSRVSGAVQRLLRRAYYRARPLLPRRAQIGLRRGFSRVQARAEFPRWPVETSLHDLYDWLFAQARALAGVPIPTIASWPRGRRWAVVLTHDVETAVGAANVRLLRDVEAKRGFRSSWNFVPHRYEVADSLLRELEDEGFEVGVHGLEHDGRDLESLRTLQRRLPEMRRYAKRWGATGFRSPATHRNWEWMPLLGFDYDSSYPDTDPYEPQAGGCCTWLPFFNENLVELPITLPQDHTLFTILQVEDEGPWLSKAAFLRERGGMALLITHPDYMLDQRHLDIYAALLDDLEADDELWRALPRDVSGWWRRRAESSLHRNGSGWVVHGPAAEDAEVLEL